MIQRVHERPRGALERQGPPAQVGARGAAGDPDVGRRLRAEGARRSRAASATASSSSSPTRRSSAGSWTPRASAAEEAGRDPSQLKCIVGAPSHVTDDLADAREQVRWFPAMVSNHVMDLIERYGTDGSSVPKALTDYVQARKFYDYNDHSRVGAKHGEFVTDEICDRFCVHRRRRADQGEAEGARGGRRRPVQRLPHDARAGGDAGRRTATGSSPSFTGSRRRSCGASCGRCSSCGRRRRSRSPPTARRCSSAPTLPGTQPAVRSCPCEGGELTQLTDYDEPVSGRFLPDGRILRRDRRGRERADAAVPARR